MFIGSVSCNKINTDPSVVSSVELSPLGSPSIVIGDSLRDTSGILAAVKARAYNIQGDLLTDAPIIYRVLDTGGVILDSIIGIATGVSLSGPIRVIADVRGLQTQIRTLYVVPEPENLAALNGIDSVKYRFTDREVFTPPLNVQLWSGTGADSVAIQAYTVSYTVISATDSLVQIVGDNGSKSLIDTTGSDGRAGRRLKVRLLHLSTPTDSVVVEASVKHRGVQISGSPVRFVIHIQPEI